MFRVYVVARIVLVAVYKCVKCLWYMVAPLVLDAVYKCAKCLGYIW